MPKINPIHVQKFLANVNYPATKQELIDTATEEGAEVEILNALGQIDDKSYETPAEVSEALNTTEKS